MKLLSSRMLSGLLALELMKILLKQPVLLLGFITAVSAYLSLPDSDE